MKCPDCGGDCTAILNNLRRELGMFTDEDILAYTRETNPNATMSDVVAFRRLMYCADCMDAETVEEAHEKIIITMSMSYPGGVFYQRIKETING